MDAARWRSFTRTAVSLLLVLCFVLPLSSCDTMAVHGATETRSADYVTGTGMVRKALGDIWSAPAVRSVGLLVVLNIFFAPLIYLRMNDLPRACATIVSAMAAAFALDLLVFVATPEPGGLLAVACWTWLFADSAWTVLRRIAMRLRAAP